MLSQHRLLRFYATTSFVWDYIYKVFQLRCENLPSWAQHKNPQILDFKRRVNKNKNYSKPANSCQKKGKSDASEATSLMFWHKTKNSLILEFYTMQKHLSELKAK